MFGNGSGQDAPAAPDTGSLWGDMFGIGSLFKVISDPALMQHTHAMMSAVIEGANANRRIEAKLDRLLGALGHGISDINAKFPVQFQPSAILEGDRADGSRGHAPATGAVDDGSRSAAEGPRSLGGPIRDDRGGDPAGKLLR
jgi:hypothetical protein